jgi:hypothetical protein
MEIDPAMESHPSSYTTSINQLENRGILTILQENNQAMIVYAIDNAKYKPLLGVVTFSSCFEV